jgi:hypothetical protein
MPNGVFPAARRTALKLCTDAGVHSGEQYPPTHDKVSRMNARHQINTVAATAAIACLLAGCSPTGWSVKQLPDESSFQRGSLVTIQEKSGITYTGIYEGSFSEPSADYMERYAATSDASVLPMIGEHVRMTTAVAGEKIWEGDFLGFDDRHLWVMKDGSPQDLYVSSLSQLSDSRGHVLQRLNLRNLFINGSIPLMTTLAIRSGERTYRVPLNDIASVSPVSPTETVALPTSGDQLRASRSSW